MKNSWWPWCSTDWAQRWQMAFPSSLQKITSFSPWGWQSFFCCGLMFSLTFFTMLARGWLGRRFQNWYLHWHTGQLLSPPLWVPDSLLFAVMQAWQKLWPQSRLRGIVRSSRQMGQVTSFCMFNCAGKSIAELPWFLPVLTTEAVLAHSLLQGRECWRDHDKKGRNRKNTDYVEI